ncbi:MAG: twin-arginine translocation signal domain-containing protein [Pseudolabrys sp.]|jgi:hypothetical protein
MTTHNRRQFLKLSAGVTAGPVLSRAGFAQTAWPAGRTIRALKIAKEAGLKFN